ncbi:hypothetical protein BJX65DRAFT_313739 [Aspergillus insuetus]
MPSPNQLTHTPIADGLLFGEGPRYRDGLLYLSDMTGRAIYAIDPSSGEKKLLCLAENQPNGLCFLPDGSLIWSSMFDAKIYRLDLTTGVNTLYADMSHIMTGYSGDMTIDSSGRVYVDDTGAKVLHGEKPQPGRLLVIDPKGCVSVAADNIVFPNALMISNDGQSIYCAETFGYGLLKWDLAADGTLSNRQNIWSPASISPTGQSGNTTDGILGIDGGCMDAEGGIWLGLLAFNKFIRLDRDGNITDEIKVNGHATACTLGGEDGKTLFLITNWFSEDEEGLFAAMTGKRTKCRISCTRVEVGKGTARP